MSKGFEESQGAEGQPTRREPEPSVVDIRVKKKLVESLEMGQEDRNPTARKRMKMTPIFRRRAHTEDLAQEKTIQIPKFSPAELPSQCGHAIQEPPVGVSEGDTTILSTSDILLNLERITTTQITILR